jgi:uncharacterized membrane protein YphA (DoxX/SURF4 family)
MSMVVLIARIALAAVFAAAAAGKLADRAGSRAAVTGLGVPRRLAPTVALGVPVGELVVAVSLIVGPWASWGALGALGLLAAFSAAIAANLGRPVRPDCHCFGQLHSSPVSVALVVRNVALAVPAVLVLVHG